MQGILVVRIDSIQEEYLDSRVGYDLATKRRLARVDYYRAPRCPTTTTTTTSLAAAALWKAPQSFTCSASISQQARALLSPLRALAIHSDVSHALASTTPAGHHYHHHHYITTSCTPPLIHVRNMTLHRRLRELLAENEHNLLTCPRTQRSATRASRGTNTLTKIETASEMKSNHHTKPRKMDQIKKVNS